MIIEYLIAFYMSPNLGLTHQTRLVIHVAFLLNGRKSSLTLNHFKVPLLNYPNSLNVT